MSNLTQFLPGSIKYQSEQEITITNGNTSGTATVALSGTTKYLLSKLGQRSTETSVANVDCTVELTNATTVTAKRGGSTGSVTVRFQVTEYV